jgi:hypothetical protein
MTSAALNLRRVAMRKVHRARAEKRAAFQASRERHAWNLKVLDREAAGEGDAYLDRTTGRYLLLPPCLPRPSAPPRPWYLRLVGG